jgi:hypothetical protein
MPIPAAANQKRKETREMNVTKFDLWKPSADNPRKWEYMGQQTLFG